MHIPTCETNQLELVRFEPALEAANRPSPDYDVGHWLYVPNFYSEYRYILGTRGEKPLICIGINPSTAAPDDLDNTLKSVERVALHNGYDSFIMFNVYAQRATNPDDMEPACNPALHRENMEAFDYVLSLDKAGAPAVWAAWGTIIEKRDYLPGCVRDMIRIGEARNAVWYSAGKRSKKGHPHHPLYLRKDSVLEPFDVSGYLDHRDFTAGLSNFFGGRSGAYEEELTNARETALRELEQRAQERGANAVVGVDVDYEVLGSNNGMLMVTASGTAVLIG